MAMDTDIWKKIRENSKAGTKQRIAQSLEDIIQDEVKTLKHEKLDEIYSKEQDYIEKEVQRRVAKIIAQKESEETTPYSIVFTKEESQKISAFIDKAYQDAKEKGKEYRGAIGGGTGIKTVNTSLGEIVTIYAYDQEFDIRGTEDW